MREAVRTSLQQANEMIHFADVKAAAVLAAIGVLTGQLPPAHSSQANGVLLAAGICLSLSALLALYTLAPQQVATTHSLYYYAHVAQLFRDDRESFVDALLDSATDEEAFERVVARQIWAANMVALHKFTRITWSIRALVIGVVALAAVPLS